MKCRANVIFIACKPESFVNKSNKTIEFQTVHFIPEDGDEPMSLTALMSLDFSKFAKLDPLCLEFDFYKQGNYVKGKIVGIED